MEDKKPLGQRIKQELAIIVVLLLLLGGSAAFLTSSPYFVPGIILFFILTFGPYAIEFAQERLKKKDGTETKSEKIRFTAFKDKDGTPKLEIGEVAE